MPQRMKRSFTISLPVLLLLGLSDVARAEGPASPKPRARAVARASAHSARPNGAAAGLLEEALRDQQIRPDQRGIVQDLKNETSVRHQATMAARRALANALAEQIQYGTIDRAALQPAIEAFADAAKAERVADNATINELHALLDPTQRAQVVDALELGAKKHEREWRVERGILARLTEPSKLTSKQRSEISRILLDAGNGAPPPSANGRARANVLQGFVNEEFSMESIAPPEEARQMVLDGTQRALDAVTKILPILTREQRALAADRLRRWR